MSGRLLLQYHMCIWGNSIRVCLPCLLSNTMFIWDQHKCLIYNWARCAAVQSPCTLRSHECIYRIYLLISDSGRSALLEIQKSTHSQ